MAAQPDIQTGTMQFRDTAPGHIDDRSNYVDPTRSLGMKRDAQLNDWFSRPIVLDEYTWEVDSPIFERINPWKQFWDNARNREKIRNYHLLRCKMHVKILINGNPFYYGRLMAAYEPLAALDNTSPSRDWVQADFVRGSQRMHVYVNPTTSEGGSLELPFFWPQNAWVVGDSEWDVMGSIVLASLNNLQHSNGSTDPLTITVMGWAEDVEYSIPTSYVAQPESGVPGSDEHDKDIISRPATNVARAAGTLSKLPVIGPYAKATEIGARAIAQTAKMFGLSAPNELHQSIYEPRAKHSIAVTDTKQSANKLTIDSKQELTIDPRTTGANLGEELTIASIAGRESFLTKFSWQLTDNVGTHLWNARVDPGLHVRNGAEYHLPACAVAALPFDYWRGTMRFRFQVVASEYHKGRIRVSYDPYKGESNRELNTHYTTIHDISDCKDFSVDVGWAQNVPFMKSIAFSSTEQIGVSPLGPAPTIGNGVITVNVLNRLTSPATDTSPVEINVFVSMLDDFEVSVPNDNLTYVKYRPKVDPPEPPRTIPESGTPEDVDNQGGDITDPQTIDTFNDALIDDPKTTMVFMGEVITSFRTLLKRAYRTEVLFVDEDNNTTTGLYSISRSAFPTYGGFVVGQNANSNSIVKHFYDGRYYNPAETTLMNYLGKAFLGWRGSTRWTADTSSLLVGGGDDAWAGVGLTFSREQKYSNKTYYTGIVSQPYTNWSQEFLNLSRGQEHRGAYIGSTSVNPIQTIEVPYLSVDRFSYTFREDSYEGTTFGPGWRLAFMAPQSDNGQDSIAVTFYVSAGEDFNFFFFNGMQPFYWESTYQLDTASPE